MVSNVGTQVSTLAFLLLILALTGSAAQAGFAGALRALPYLIFSLPAGALIDRWDRKLAMILCDTGRALSLASIPVALAIGHLTIMQLYLVSAIEGMLFVFFNIAEAACLPRVVAKEQLPAATAQSMATDGVTALVGPSLGGALYTAGSMLPFLADAVSYTVSVCSLFFIKTTFQKERVAARHKLWIEIREGLAWLWHQPLIRFIAILTGGSNLISSGYILIIIVLAQRQNASSFLIGLIFAVGGIGGIIGALAAPFFQKRLSFGQAIIGTMWLLALSMPLYAIAPKSRPRVLLERFGANALVVLLAPVLTWLTITFGALLANLNVNQGRVLAASFSTLPPALITLGLVYALAGRLRYVALLSIVTAYLVLSYLEESLEGNIQFPTWVMSLSIYHLYGNPIFVGMNWTNFLGMTGVAVVLLVISLIQFRTADIKLG